MRQQTDLMAVSRDRGGTYASAATQGAPQATQCADRFHLLKNLGEAVEDLLARHLSASRKHQVEVALEEQTPNWLPERKARRSQTSEALPSVYQQDHMARYQQMIKLHEQGMTQHAIAQQIGMSHQTVQRWLAAGAFPQSTRHHYVSQLDPYMPYLILRWTQGCHNIAQLFRELEARGYRGSYASVHDNIVRRLQFFASGIEKDKDAVRAGLTWWGSQRHGGRSCDQTQIDQKTGLWPGRISAASQACPSRHVVVDQQITSDSRFLIQQG